MADAVRVGVNGSVKGWTEATVEAGLAAHGTGPYVYLVGAGHEPANALRMAEADGDAIHLVRLMTPLTSESVNQYLARQGPVIERWRAEAGGLGGRLVFVPGNEPDVATGENTDVPVAWPAVDFTNYFLRLAGALRRQYPGIILANPAWSVERTGWLGPQMAAAVDWVTCHSYWEATHPEDIHNPGLGASWQHVAAMAPGKPLIVTEVNSVGGLVPEQMAEWLSSVEGGVYGACLFIADAEGTPWANFACPSVDIQRTMELYRSLRQTPPDEPPAPPERETDMTLWDAIKAATNDPVVRAAMLFGAAMETGTITAPFPDQYGGGPGRGPFQIEAGPGGSHTGEIGEDAARDPAQAVAFMLGEYQRAAARTPRGAFADTATYLATIAYRAERPAVMYPAERIARAYNLAFPTSGPPSPAPAPPAKDYLFITPVDAPIAQGSMGTFSHAGSRPGSVFYAIDYAPLALFSPIRCIGDGTVIYEGFNHPLEGQTGHTLCVRHADGYESRYCHLSDWTAHLGDSVREGQIIAKSGAPDYPYAGANGYGSGPHLHFSVSLDGRWIKVEEMMADGRMVDAAQAGHGKGKKMFSTDPVDDGLVELTWVSLGAALNRDAAIFQDWKKRQYTDGEILGVPTTEEKDVGWGTIQIFSTGVTASWNPNDNQVRWHGHAA
jgi:murein DD-endopeptidase MepM/ murein hydrolase activator NlpD